MTMFKNFLRAGKIFLIGILFGILFCIIANFSFESAAHVTRGFLETKASAFPSDAGLLSLAMFLNNSLVAVLASVGPAGLILLVLWGRRESDLWKKMDDSSLGEWLDRHVWSLSRRLKPEFRRIEGKLNRDVFVIAYGLPALVLIVNGLFFGFLLVDDYLEYGLSGVWGFLKWTAPHGIIEIPAIIGSASLGLSLADGLLGHLYRGETQRARERAKEQVRSRDTVLKLFSLLGLLALAAFVEAFLTARIAYSL